MDGALAAVYDAVVNGVPLPPVTGLPPVLITPDNYRELLGC
jgi:hypothetical protein